MGLTSIGEAVRAAAPGPVLAGELFPLNNCGKVRVTYNWLYSALNCDPSDQSTFAWVLQKNPDGSVALSPQQPYSGMTLFASVRPDLSYFVQVQAPYSADWITQVGADEEMTLTELGLLTIELQGLNGSYIGLNGSMTSHDDHSGYLLQSNVTSPSQSSQFFVAVSANLQAAASAPLVSSLAPEQVVAELERVAAAEPEQFAQHILAMATNV